MNKNEYWLSGIRISISDDGEVIKMELMNESSQNDDDNVFPAFLIPSQGYKKYVDSMIAIGYKIQNSGINLGFPTKGGE